MVKIIEDGGLYEYREKNGKSIKIKIPKRKPKDKLSRKKEVKKYRNLSKGQKWWRSLTLVEQADWRYEMMLKKKGEADWYFEYEQCKKEGHFRKD